MSQVSTDLGSKIQSKLQKKLSEKKSKAKGLKKSGKSPKSPEMAGNRHDMTQEMENPGDTEQDLDLLRDLGDSDSGSELKFDSSGKGVEDDEVSQFSKKEKKVTESSKKNAKENAKDNTKEAVQNDKKAAIKEAELLAKEAKKMAKQEAKSAVDETPKIEKTKLNGTEKDSHGQTQIKFGDSLTLEPSPEWYSPDIAPPTESSSKLSDSEIQHLFDKAKEFLNRCNQKYEQENIKSTSEKQFMTQLLTAGTLNDKISALTLLIQESPLHSIKHFNMLQGLCRKKSKGSAMQALTAIKDLMIGGVLPNRKLKWFKNQPLRKDTDPRWLVVWAFEDWLKQYYFSLLETLEQLSHDQVVYIRSNAVVHILDLLKSKPEQEVNLLRLGVNKLGDSDRKVASKVSYLLLDLQQVHPAMKTIVINAISELLFRTRDYHARYYSVITLNQTILAHKETEVANSLVRLYLSLFERLLAEWQKYRKPRADEAPAQKVKKPRWKNKGKKGKKGGERQEKKSTETIKEEEAERLTLAILAGLNRAYPFSQLPREVFDKHLDTLYRVTHSANFNTSVQALNLIFQISKSEKSLSDRYFRTLYESLLDSRLAVSSKLRLYLNLLFKSLREDDNMTRLGAFCKRLVQMAVHWLNIGVVAASIYLTKELRKFMPRIEDLLNGEKIDENPELIYDGRTRDPLYSHADNAKLWEIIPLLHHFHPTVTVYAQGFVDNSPGISKPDLSLHTLAHFLDRFVYKNPRQKASIKGTSIMQPLAGATGVNSIGGGAATPANMTDWSKTNLSDIDASEKFFYQYFVSRADRIKKPKGEKGNQEDMDEDDIWNALVKSQPELEGDSDEEKDMSEDDVDMDDMSDEEEEEIEDSSDGEEEETFGENWEELNDSDVSVFLDEESDREIETKQRKRSHDEEGLKKSKRQKLKELPTFASVDDYAKYLESSDEDYS